MGTGELNAGGNPAMESHPIRSVEGMKILQVASGFGLPDTVRGGTVHLS